VSKPRKDEGLRINLTGPVGVRKGNIVLDCRDKGVKLHVVWDGRGSLDISGDAHTYRSSLLELTHRQRHDPPRLVSLISLKSSTR